MGHAGAVLALAVLAQLACGSEPAPVDAALASEPAASTSVSPTAKLDTLEELRRDLAAPRHPADGGGKAWLDGGTAEVVAGGSGSFPVVYEAGPLGIAEGGWLFLQPSPFWGWSPPQVTAADRHGYTVVQTGSDGVRLEAQEAGGLLAIRIAGRALGPGERVTVHYGAGAAGARVDTYAESRSRLWLAVDGDGDGVRKVLADSPAVTVVAGPPARLVLTLPSVVRPNAEARLTVAVLDEVGNAGARYTGSIELASQPALDGLPPRLEVGPEQRGLAQLLVRVGEEGTYRVHARAAGGLEADSNPMVVTASGPRVLWGDLHGHSGLSDGSGTPEDYLRYARDVAALDVAALTDHDHWGMLLLDQNPELWQETREQTRRFHDPGSFVTLLGFEWTSWIHGHRHVLYFADEGEVLSSLDPRYESPLGLWHALRGKPALTVAHHSAGGPVATNWGIPPDPELEPVTEVTSVHGASEAGDAPAPIYSPAAGTSVRDALDRGFRFGFVGSGDSHDGHPGLAHLLAPSGGLAAIVAEEATREAVLAALRARRVYATNGPRILLRFAVGGHPMGSVVTLDGDEGQDEELAVVVTGTAPVERLDVIRSGAVISSLAGEGQPELAATLRLDRLHAGEYVYVRVVQAGGGAAWSSPVFFTTEGS